VPCAQHGTDHKHRGTPAQSGPLRSQRLTQRATGRSRTATLPQRGDRRWARGHPGRNMRAGNLNPAIGHRAYPYPGMPLDFLQGVGPSCEREILAYLPPPPVGVQCGASLAWAIAGSFLAESVSGDSVRAGVLVTANFAATPPIRTRRRQPEGPASPARARPRQAARKWASIAARARSPPARSSPG